MLREFFASLYTCYGYYEIGNKINYILCVCVCVGHKKIVFALTDTYITV